MAAEQTNEHLQSIIERAKGQRPLVDGPDLSPATRAEMGRVVAAARAESDLIIPDTADLQEQFAVVALAFIDALTERQNLSDAWRYLFPRASRRKQDHARAEGVRLLELVKLSFPRVGDFMRPFFYRAGIHPAMLVNRLFRMISEGRDTEALAAIRVCMRLMDLDRPDAQISTVLGAAVITPVTRPFAVKPAAEDPPRAVVPTDVQDAEFCDVPDGRDTDTFTQ